MGIIILLAAAAGVYFLVSQGPSDAQKIADSGGGILKPGMTIPQIAQEVQTVRDDQGRVIPQPNTVTDPTTGKSFFIPPPPEARPANTPQMQAAALLKPTVADPKTAKPDIARQLALTVSQDIRLQGRNYNHETLKAFQTAAGMKPDGFYGGRSRGALLWYGVSDPPPIIYKPLTTVPYKPSA